MKSVYIAGPMSGYPQFNFPAFFTAQHTLERLGWKVWNPANKDGEDEAVLSTPDGNAAEAIAKGFDFRAAFKWDCEKIIDGDAIYMLRGWEKSPGATAEHMVGKFVKTHNPKFEFMYQ
jgi:hypothetical protein